jgi:transposase
MQTLKKFTREELEGFSKEQFIELVLFLQDRIEQFEDRLSKLEKNSSNSSKPPSSDNKPNKDLNLREKSGKSSGGQKGHTGITRKLVDSPDKIIQHVPPDECEYCGKSLAKVIATIMSRRQVVDIPPIKAEVTEHQQLEKTCSCGHKNAGRFPDGVKAPVQFGPYFQSLILYLSIRHHIPYNRVAEIMEELIGEKISERTIENILELANKRAGPLYELIKKRLKDSRCVGSDETGTRVNGVNFFLWVWQNMFYSFFAVDKRRSYKVIQKHFGEDFKGTLVHDCFGAQNKTNAKKHQLCHAHLLRDLKYCIQEESSFWAYEVTILLLSSQKVRPFIWERGFDKKLREKTIKSFEKRLEELLAREVTKTETIKLQKRIKKHKDKILFFMTTKDVPPDNNGSERAIRNAKIHKKISGGFRNELAAQRYAVLMSIIDTAKKQGLKMFDACQKLLRRTLTLQPTSC